MAHRGEPRTERRRRVGDELGAVEKKASVARVAAAMSGAWKMSGRTAEGCRSSGYCGMQPYDAALHSLRRRHGIETSREGGGTLHHPASRTKRRAHDVHRAPRGVHEGPSGGRSHRPSPDVQPPSGSACDRARSARPGADQARPVAGSGHRGSCGPSSAPLARRERLHPPCGFTMTLLLLHGPRSWR